jgi:hypothetical protein
MIALMSLAGEWFAGKYGLFVVVEESVLGLSASWDGGNGVWLVFGVKIDRGGEVTEVTGLEGAYG